MKYVALALVLLGLAFVVVAITPSTPSATVQTPTTDSTTNTDWTTIGFAAILAFVVGYIAGRKTGD